MKKNFDFFRQILFKFYNYKKLKLDNLTKTLIDALRFFLWFLSPQAIHIAKFSIEFVGSKHAPALWSLEKSTDYGKTWSVWHFITNDPYNCELLGIESTSDGTSTADNSTCLMQPYVVNQPITIDLMKNHQLTTNKVKSDTLVEWTRATSVRLHFYGLKVNLKHFPLLKKPNITETVNSFDAWTIFCKLSNLLNFQYNGNECVVFSISMR